MTKNRNGSRAALALIAAVSFAGALGAAAPAAATPSYDGVWSVLIVTEKGTCDRAYRYPVRISKGALVNEGSSPVTVSGKVGGNGAVNVLVTYGDKSANGSGRLSGNMGAGSWTGGGCAGTWEAERRG